MGHVIATFIAKRHAAAALSRALGTAPAYKLNHAELLIVPVSDDAFDTVLIAKGESAPAGTEFWRLTETLMDIAAEVSANFGPVAYAETDYFGGAGVRGWCVVDADNRDRGSSGTDVTIGLRDRVTE